MLEQKVNVKQSTLHIVIGWKITKSIAFVASVGSFFSLLLRSFNFGSHSCAT